MTALTRATTKRHEAPRVGTPMPLRICTDKTIQMRCKSEYDGVDVDNDDEEVVDVVVVVLDDDDDSDDDEGIRVEVCSSPLFSSLISIKLSLDEDNDSSSFTSAAAAAAAVEDDEEERSSIV